MFTLRDLAKPENMLAWLNADGKPPTVYVETVASRARWYGATKQKEAKPVADKETLDLWWTEYRNELRTQWDKHPMNHMKRKTLGQLLAECFSKALGIKKGSIAERRKAAIAMFPEMYQPAA